MFKLMYRNVMSIDTLNSPLFPCSTSVYLYRNVVCAGVGVLLLLPEVSFFFESGGQATLIPESEIWTRVESFNSCRFSTIGLWYTILSRQPSIFGGV